MPDNDVAAVNTLSGSFLSFLEQQSGVFLHNVIEQLVKILATLLGRFECYRFILLTKSV